MTDWWQVVASVAGGLVLLWIAMVGVIALASRSKSDGSGTLTEALRLLPDVVALLRGLLSDPDVPKRVRLWLVLLLAYLASPIDLVPDFIPVLGYADDAIVTALVLRSVIRTAGPEAIERHWSGTDAGLKTIKHLTAQR